MIAPVTVALGYHILPLQGKCKRTVQISRSLSFNSQFGKLTDRIEPRALSLSKGPRSFVHNELRMWKPTLKVSLVLQA